MNIFSKSHKKSGFTLIELLVVISIISILSSVVMASLNTARTKARDVKRRAELKQVQIGLQLYYVTNNGTYPVTGPGVWWGNCTDFGSHETSGANGWVQNLAPTHMPVLPLDPKPNGAGGCYLYRSDTGTDYKLLAHQTMEVCTVPPGIPSTDPMYDIVRAGQCTIGIFTPGGSGY